MDYIGLLVHDFIVPHKNSCSVLSKKLTHLLLGPFKMKWNTNDGYFFWGGWNGVHVRSELPGMLVCSLAASKQPLNLILRLIRARTHGPLEAECSTCMYLWTHKPKDWVRACTTDLESTPPFFVPVFFTYLHPINQQKSETALHHAIVCDFIESLFLGIFKGLNLSFPE